MSIESTKKITENVDGWLTINEGKLLYKLARKCSGKGVIVEIGSWKGKSTIWLGAGSKCGNQAKIYAIDPHKGSSEHKKRYGKLWTFDEFLKNIKKSKIEDLVIPLVNTSQEAAKILNYPVELIFIDGAHEYDYVKLDFELWHPKVIKGGIIAFHDSKWPGPNKVIKNSLYNKDNFKNVRVVDSITYGIKIRKTNLKDIIRSKYFPFIWKLFIIAKKQKFAGPVKFIGRYVRDSILR